MQEHEQELNEEKRAEEQPKIEKGIDEKKYVVFDYFKEHTGFLAACLSGLIAVLSFVLRFCVVRYNEAYLAYWNINRIYASHGSGNQLYYLGCVFVFSFALFVVHMFLAGTSEAYSYYNQHLSLLRRYKIERKRSRRQLEKSEKQFNKKLENFSDRQKESEEIKKLSLQITQAKQSVDCDMSSEAPMETIRRELQGYIGWNVAVSIFASWLVVFCALFIRQETFSTKTFLLIAGSAGLIVLADVLIYFVPAHFGSRCSKKKIKKLEEKTKTAELPTLPTKRFPLRDMLFGGVKESLSDEKIRVFILQICLAVALMLFSCPVYGQSAASSCKEFPVFCDGEKTYAIVYNNGVSIFAQEAEIEGNCITIQTANQKITSAQEITFQICNFDKVVKNETFER